MSGMRTIIRALALLLCLAATAAHAQLPQTLPSNSVVGRLGIGSGPGQAIPFTTLSPLILGYGTDTNTLNSRTSDYTVGVTDCGKTIQLGTGSTGFFTLTFAAATGFPSTCSVLVANGDTARGKAISGLTGISTLWPSQVLGAKVINGAWALTDDPGLWRPTSSVTFCIDTANGSDASDGLTAYSVNAGAGTCAVSAEAFQTVQKCIDVITSQMFLRLDLMKPVCQIADNSAIAQAPLIRQYTGAYFYQQNQPTITGNCTTAGNVVMKGQSTGGVFTTAAMANAWTIDCLDINATSAGDTAIFCDWASDINFKSIRFTRAATASAVVSRYGCRIEILAGAQIVISANQSAFFNASSNSVILAQGSPGSVTITHSGTPAYSSAFAVVADGGFVDLQAVTFSGSATGSRYLALGAARLIPAGTSLPGNAAGTYATCWYGSTSGSACIGASDVAGGGGVVKIPSNVNGTMAVSASSPIALDGTTGALTLGIVPAANGGLGNALYAQTLLNGPSCTTVDLNPGAPPTDTNINLNLPSTNYRVNAIFLNNVGGATASLTTAQLGVFTAGGGGGLQLVAPALVNTITSNTINVDRNVAALTVTGNAANALNVNPLVARVTVAQGAAASAKLCIYGSPMP